MEIDKLLIGLCMGFCIGLLFGVLWMKWICGDSMIDIYYLEGHIDEILCEMGIIGEVEDGSN